MKVDFSKVKLGRSYSREELADLWGYTSFHAIARGVVTPRDSHLIVLFVTEEKQMSAEPYQDVLSGDLLKWEGPNDHFAEGRMVNAQENGEEIHLFYRERHHSPFVYKGRLLVTERNRYTDRPSKFTFKLCDYRPDSE